MAEQWVPAARALEIVGNPYTLCARLHAGMIEARADRILISGEEVDYREIPKGFWWAEGREALAQDWSAGDFATWIKNKHKIQVFGARFSAEGLLGALPIDARPLAARSLSVIGNPDWLVASEAKRHVQRYIQNAGAAAVGIVMHARLGFVRACAVEARGSKSGQPKAWDWEEREWEVPSWFWRDFTDPDASVRDWEWGKFSGRCHQGSEFRSMELDGVHFLRESLDCLKPASQGEDQASPERGRKRKYNWEEATNHVWGEVYRGDLKPSQQSDIEQALQRVLRKGDVEPSEATVRPFARIIWEEFQKD